MARHVRHELHNWSEIKQCDFNFLWVTRITQLLSRFTWIFLCSVIFNWTENHCPVLFTFYNFTERIMVWTQDKVYFILYTKRIKSESVFSNFNFACNVTEGAIIFFDTYLLFVHSTLLKKGTKGGGVDDGGRMCEKCTTPDRPLRCVQSCIKE